MKREFLLALWVALGLLTCIPGHGQSDSAILTNRKGAAQALAKWLPSNHALAVLYFIDNQEPKYYHQKSHGWYRAIRGGPVRKTFGETFNVPLPAGEHTLSVNFNLSRANGSISAQDPLDMKFSAQTGHTYELGCEVAKGQWGAFLVDVTDATHPVNVPWSK